tara:strand:- start:309 stop:2009 length:1701 start_codon:yes stop_codon:yes gene_type:complete
MAIKYPDILEHNNPNFPLVDITSLKGVAYPLGALIDTGSIPSAKRNPGAIVFITSSGEFFGYIGDDAANWDTPTNWEPLGGGSGIFEQTGSFFATTNDLQITGSLTTTGSVNLTLDTSSTPINKVMMYDDATGQVFITSSAAVGGSSIEFLGESDPNIPSPQIIQSIETLDFNDDETLIQFDTSTGNLKFIFGQPPAPSVGISQTGFITNKFNLEEQTFTVNGTYDRQANGFISASLKETDPDTLTLASRSSEPPTSALTKLFTNRTGSKSSPEYRFTMELTSSDAISGLDDFKISTLNLNRNKLDPFQPTNTFDTSQISQFGGVSQIYSNNYIEEGATGSISYTASKGGNDQNYRFIRLDDASTNNSVTMAPSANGFIQISGSIDITTKANSHTFQFRSNANYDSDNGPGATPNISGDPLNDPLVIKNMQSSLKTYNRIKSPRIAAFLIPQTASIISNPEDIDFWAKNAQISTKPGELGQLFYQSHSPTAGNPNNLVGYIQNVNNSIHVIVISNSYTLTDVVAGGFAGFLSAFTLYPNVNGYNVYIGNNVQGPTGGLAQEYKLIT